MVNLSTVQNTAPAASSTTLPAPGPNNPPAVTKQSPTQSVADALTALFQRETPRQTLVPTRDANGNPVIKTSDGFSISLTANSQDITITSPEGYTTKIWGDPHVEESDGTKWDFHAKSSFMFGGNKITLTTTPYGSTGATVVKKLTIYHGDQRITIDDIDLNKPKLVSYSFDGKVHDKNLQDGNQYRLQTEGTAFSWKLFKSKS